MDETPILDLLGCFAVAGELGRGQPAGHLSRTAAIAVATAERLGLDDAARGDVFQASLLAHAGCTAGMSEVASVLLCDELALVRDVCICDPSHEFAVLRVLLRHAGSGGGSVARLRSIARLPSAGAAALREMEAGCSEVGPHIAARLGMTPGTVDALANICETWSGKGPRKRSGDEIPLASRIVNAAMTAEIFLSNGGRDAAVDAVRRRAGGSLDPLVAGTVADMLADPGVLAAVERASEWDAVANLDPASRETPAGIDLDVLTLACADFADLKVPGAAAHSRRVGQLAEAILLRLGNRRESDLARRAGHVHAIGQVALPAEVLRPSGRRRSLAETEQFRLHPVYTRRILSHSPVLAAIGVVGAMHHERADGTGYPDGRSGADFSQAARAVAAACAWDESWSAAEGLAVEQAIAAFRDGGGQEAFGQEVTTALCDEVAGARHGRRPPGPEGLTGRELEVLTLAATGKTVREIADALVISKHTARHHLESIYSKAGVSSRAGVTLFAIEAGLFG